MVDQYLFFALCSLKKIFQNCNALTNTHVQDELLQVLGKRCLFVLLTPIVVSRPVFRIFHI